MTSLPCVPYHLMWYIVCVNWLKFTHTQGNVGQRSCVLAKLALLSLQILLPLVLAKEMYVESLLRRSPYVKQCREIYSQKNVVEIRYHICTILYCQVIPACVSTKAKKF